MNLLHARVRPGFNAWPAQLAGHAGRGELHLDDTPESSKDEHQNYGRLDVPATGRDQLQSTPPLAEVPGPLPPGTPRSRRPGRRNALRFSLVTGITTVALFVGYAVVNAAHHGWDDFLSGAYKAVQTNDAAPTPSPDPAASTTPSPNQARPSVAEFVQETHGFAAQFRTPPLSTQQQRPAFDGASYTIYTFKAYDQDSTQVINAASLPCTPRPESLDAALEQSVEKAVVSIADQMTAEPVIDSQARGEVQGFPAEWRSFTLTLPNGQQATGQILTVAHGTTIIEVLSAGTADSQAKETTDFIESFRLLDSSAPAAPLCTEPAAAGPA